MKRLSRKQKKQQAEKLFLDFLEGRISTTEFWEAYKSNNDIQSVLVNDKKRYKRTFLLGGIKMFHFGKGPFDKWNTFHPDNILSACNINNPYHVYLLANVINRYFENRKIQIKCKNREYLLWKLYEKIVPHYLEIVDAEFLGRVWNSSAEELNKTERIKYCKHEIEKMYPYDKRPPVWIQNPEWPVDEEGPMVFSHQKCEIGRAIYYFYNRETKKQVEIIQYE